MVLVSQFASIAASIAFILFPLVVSAALTPEGDATDPSSKAQKACEKGSADSSSPKGPITGGGREYDNVIYVFKSKVVVKCRPVQGLSPGKVVFCDLSGGCRIVSKDSQQGRNLIEMFETARSIGVPAGDSYNVHPQDLVERLLGHEQMQQLNTIIDRELNRGYTYQYSSVIDTIGRFSSSEDTLGSLSQASDDAFSIISDIARESGVKPSPPLTPLPKVYPPSYELSSPPEPYLTDAYPIGRELEPEYQFENDVPLPALRQRLDNVIAPSTFSPRSLSPGSNLGSGAEPPSTGGVWSGVRYYLINPGRILGDSWSYIRSLFW